MTGPSHAMLAVLGGTFDPIHYGHLRAALEARENLELTSLTLLPAGQPPHRSGTVASAEHRLAMLEQAVNEYPDLRVDAREVRREGYSYMVDTLFEIRAEIGQQRPLALLVGQDAVNQLDSWMRWRQLFDLAHIIVMRRPKSEHNYSTELANEIRPRLRSQLADLRQHASGLVLPLEVTQLAISSTDIRQRLMQGKSCRFLLPDSVIAFIREHHLYEPALH